MDVAAAAVAAAVVVGVVVAKRSVVVAVLGGRPVPGTFGFSEMQKERECDWIDFNGRNEMGMK